MGWRHVSLSSAICLLYLASNQGSVNTKKRNPVSWAMMELTQEQDEEIKPSLPGQRGKVKLSNRKVRDRASEGDTTRQPALDLIFSAVVPAKSNRLGPWESDQEHNKKRNEVE